MSGVVNSAGTPAINPNASDPREQLQALLANQGAIPSGPAPSSPLQNILNAVAQAGAVGLSNDPGQALAQQVAQQRQQQFQQQQQAEARQFEMQMQNRAIQIQDLQNQIAEKRTIEAEGRSEARQIKKEDRDYNRALEEQDRNFNYQTQLQELKDKNEYNQRVKLSELEIAGKEKLQRDHNEFVQQMDELKMKDKQLGDQIDLAATYGAYGMSDDMAYEIAGKRRRGEKLTSAESKAVDKINSQIRAERIQKNTPRSGGSGGAGSSLNNLNEKFINGLMSKAMTEDYVELQTGQVVDAKSVPKDLMGQPVGVKRQLSAAEGMKYVVDNILPIAAAVKEKGLGAVMQTGPNLDIQTNKVVNSIDGFLKQGIGKDFIMNQLTEQYKNAQDPEQKQALQNGMMILKGKKDADVLPQNELPFSPINRNQLAPTTFGGIVKDMFSSAPAQPKPATPQRKLTRQEIMSGKE